MSTPTSTQDAQELERPPLLRSCPTCLADEWTLCTSAWTGETLPVGRSHIDRVLPPTTAQMRAVWDGVERRQGPDPWIPPATRDAIEAVGARRGIDQGAEDAASRVLFWASAHGTDLTRDDLRIIDLVVDVIRGRR